MESERFNELLSGIREQLNDKYVEYMLVVVNHSDVDTDEGIIGGSSSNGFETIADMLFNAAMNGERGPQLFIERILDKVMDVTGQHLRRKNMNTNDVN